MTCSNSINEVPGTQDGDLLDLTKLTAWVEEVRKILGERKRKAVGDLCIGQVLSYAKPEANDVWASQCNSRTARTIA